MGTELADRPRAVGTWTKVALVVLSVVAFTLGCLALLESVTLNHGCESYSGCVPDNEAIAILWAGIAVAVVLFVSAGIAITSCLSAPRYRHQVRAGVALGALGGVGWVFWLLMVFTAGIRATT